MTNQNRESKELAEFFTFPQPAIFQEYVEVEVEDEWAKLILGLFVRYTAHVSEVK